MQNYYILKQDKYYSSFISHSCLLTPQTVVKPVKALTSKWKIKLQETVRLFIVIIVLKLMLRSIQTQQNKIKLGQTDCSLSS